MKVYHITNDIAEASGVGTFVRRISGELNALGVESHVLTEVPETLEEAVLPDIVHIHGMWLGLHHAALRWAKLAGCKVVWSTHGMTAPWSMHHKWWKKLPAWLLYQWRDLKAADLLHATTDQEVGWNRRFGLNKQCCIPLGTDLPKLSFSRRDQKERKVKTLLFVGRIYPVKAIDRIIAAFQSVAHEDWRLRIVGPDEAGHLQELKALIHSLCPCDSVLKIEFPGPKYGDDLSAEYDNCDCAILVSHTENFGATIVDGMAHAKPVIAGTKTPWSRVRDYHCGWWVDNSVESLAKTLQEMMSMPHDELELMGARGRSWVESEFTWPAVGKAMLSAYEKVLNTDSHF